MAIIPRVNPASVSRIGELPSARNEVRVSSEPAEAMGRAVQGLGEVANKIYQQKVEENASAALMDARRQFDDYENSTFDPENPDGIEHYQGRDALGAEDALIPAARERLEAIGASLPPAARPRWAQIAYQAESAFGDRVRRTAYQRHDQWQQFTRKSSQDALANSAAVAIGSGDADTFVPKLAEATAVFEQNLRLQLGQDADVSEASRQFQSGLVRSGIDQALSRQDFQTANALLNRFRPMMSAADIEAANRAVVPYNQADQAAEAAADILAGGDGTPAGVNVDLDPNMPPAERAAAERVIQEDIARNPPANRQLPGEHLQRGQPFYSVVEQIIQPFGARITSTTGDTHNVGSLHPSGAAMDIGVKEYTPERQAALLSALQADPRLYVVDERRRPAGQAVWSAPHFHVEIRGARANRGGDVGGQLRPRGAPPANLTEAIARIRTRFPNDRAMQDRVITLAQRHFQEQEQAKRDQMEEINLAINRSAPGADLTTILTPAQQQVLRDSGDWDRWEQSQRARVTAGFVRDDPQYASDMNEAILRNQVLWARNFDPNSPENVRLLSQETRGRLAALRDKTRDAQTQAAAVQDYASESEALNTLIYAPLGIASGQGSNPAENRRNDQARVAVSTRWYSVKQEWARAHPGEKMSDEQRDKVLKALAAEFAMNRMGDAKTRNAAVAAGTAFGADVPESARAQIAADGLRRGVLLNDADIRAIYQGTKQ